MTRSKKVWLAGSATLVVGLAVLVVALRPGSFSWDPPPAGTVMAESPAPHGSLHARVIAGPVAGHYIFELNRGELTQVIARREISAPVGYHPHRVIVEWTSDSAAVAVIDHDFGEGNLRFALHP